MTPTIAGRWLYETYCESSDWKNWQGMPCPVRENLGDSVTGHWNYLAQKLNE